MDGRWKGKLERRKERGREEEVLRDRREWVGGGKAEREEYL